MIDYETIARSNHRSGMNCASAVYDALGMNNPNKTTPPRPREQDGMCGAVLAAEQTIREAGGTEDDVKEFGKRFTERYGHLKCSELRGFLSGKCNDYVGVAAALVAQMGILNDPE
ncbi:MAG: C_GCAxxG_C_C family protein [Lachnospiraceae bacterium]|nr:C_GCAxxG_C_C family protein [Lachnospiraceae bacterium]